MGSCARMHYSSIPRRPRGKPGDRCGRTFRREKVCDGTRIFAAYHGSRRNLAACPKTPLICLGVSCTWFTPEAHNSSRGSGSSTIRPNYELVPHCCSRKADETKSHIIIESSLQKFCQVDLDFSCFSCLFLLFACLFRLVSFFLLFSFLSFIFFSFLCFFSSN